MMGNLPAKSRKLMTNILLPIIFALRGGGMDLFLVIKGRSKVSVPPIGAVLRMKLYMMSKLCQNKKRNYGKLCRNGIS